MTRALFYPFLFFSLVLPFSACTPEEVIPIEEDQSEAYFLSQDYVIAHRGYWNKKEAPQNSRAAFERALGLKIYGVEFDVRQTKDGRLVVCHDAVFDGKTISNCTYGELCTSKLDNGETIPLFEDFLRIRKETETSVKLIIDIKNCSIADLVQPIDEYDLQDEVVYITFTKRYCLQLAELDYGANAYYSNNSTTPDEIKEYGFGGVCYSQSFLKDNLDYIDIANSLDLRIMVWTVNNSKRIRDFSSKRVYVITDYPEEF